MIVRHQDTVSCQYLPEQGCEESQQIQEDLTASLAVLLSILREIPEALGTITKNTDFDLTNIALQLQPST